MHTDIRNSPFENLGLWKNIEGNKASHMPEQKKFYQLNVLLQGTPGRQ